MHQGQKTFCGELGIINRFSPDSSFLNVLLLQVIYHYLTENTFQFAFLKISIDFKIIGLENITTHHEITHFL